MIERIRVEPISTYLERYRKGGVESGHSVDAACLTTQRRYTVATQSISRSNGPGHE